MVCSSLEPIQPPRQRSNITFFFFHFSRPTHSFSQLLLSGTLQLFKQLHDLSVYSLNNFLSRLLCASLPCYSFSRPKCALFLYPNTSSFRSTSYRKHIHYLIHFILFHIQFFAHKICVFFIFQRLSSLAYIKFHVSLRICNLTKINTKLL